MSELKTGVSLTQLTAATEYDTEHARELLDTELSKPEYSASIQDLLEVLLARLDRWLVDTFTGGAGEVPAGAYWLLPIVIVALIAVTLLLARWARVRRRTRASSTQPQDRQAEYRDVVASADEAWENHDFDAALLGYFEALSRYAALVEPLDSVHTLRSDVVSSRLRGLTAIEIAQAVGRRDTSLSAAAFRAADAFNEVHYGERPATQEAAGAVRDAVAAADKQLNRAKAAA